MRGSRANEVVERERCQKDVFPFVCVPGDVCYGVCAQMWDCVWVTCVRAWDEDKDVWGGTCGGEGEWEVKGGVDEWG